MRRLILSAVSAALYLWCAASPAAAQSGARCHGGASFQQWLEGFKREAAGQGISASTFAAAAPYLTFDPGVIRKDRGQGVFQQTFLQFSDRMVNQRMGAGVARMRQHASLLQRIEQQSGVPGAAIVAFWGLETDFGADSGKLPVLRSLVTLAYDCRRPHMFRDELLYALRIVERGDLPPGEMVGAWAGEIGQTQFSPSAYFKYALDGDGDGRRDLIHSGPDALASSANLLAKEGWRRGEPWLSEVRLPAADLPWDQAELDIKHPRSQWARWGVTLANGSPLPADAMTAALLLPMGRLGPAFLAYHNFGVFLKWNESLVYATTAAYYAARLAGAPAVHRGRGQPEALSAAQVSELQRLLTKQGAAIGKIDGKLGMQTRKGVKAAQMKLGLPADSYPTAELIARLSGR
jgi:lytic murein transglycosylase